MALKKTSKFQSVLVQSSAESSDFSEIVDSEIDEIVQSKRFNGAKSATTTVFPKIRDKSVKIESIIIDEEKDASSYLRKCLISKFPNIYINGEATNYLQAHSLIKRSAPSLAFVDASTFYNSPISTLAEQHNNFDIVLISNRSEDAIDAIRQGVCGFILKPIKVEQVVASVESALRKVAEKSHYHELENNERIDNPLLPHTKLIGIPTIEGMDFLYAHEIVRCEGLQKCTRIVSTQDKCIVSSYNIGEFRKLLEVYGFFACHKSHLINLMHVKKLTREGFVFLSDSAAVPLARRKRIEFLQLLKHL